MFSILLIVGAYVLLVAAMYVFQGKLLYAPGGEGPERAPIHRLAPWPKAESYRGFVSYDGRDASLGTVLVWHGNAGTALDRVYFVRALELRGYKVVLMEYPGYGRRSGPMNERSFVSDAVQSAEMAKHTFGGPLYVIGESMGCGIATAVAAVKALDVKGAILITPWANLPDLAQSKFRIFPVKWITRDKYNNIENLTHFSGPVAVAMAAGDEVIPIKHTQRLYESIRSRKHMVVFKGAGHNNWPTDAKALWWGEVLRFVMDAPEGKKCQ